MKQVFSIIDPFQIYFRPDTYIICFNMIQQGKKMYFPIFISLFVYGKERQNRFTWSYDDLCVDGRIFVSRCLSRSICNIGSAKRTFYCDLDLFPPHKIKEVIRRHFDCLKNWKVFFLIKLCNVIISVKLSTHHYKENDFHKKLIKNKTICKVCPYFIFSYQINELNKTIFDISISVGKQ